MIIDQINKIKKTQLSEPFQNWISTLLFIPLAIYFRFIIGTSLISDKDFHAYSRSVWILGSIFFFWLLWKWLFDDQVIRTGQELFIGVFFLVACLSTAFSANISLSLEKLLDISTYIFGIYLLLDLRKSPRLWQGIINAILLTAGLSSLLILISAIPWIKLYQLTLVQVLTNPTYLLKVIPRLPYSLGLHQSITAGYLVLILPLAVFQLIQSEKFFWKAIQIIGIILNIAVLLLTQSRGGLLGLVFLIFTLILTYREEIWGLIRNNKVWGIITIFSLVLAGTAFIFVIGKSRGFSLEGRTIQMRFDQWRIAFQIIRNKPWFGEGLGTFGQTYLELRDAAFNPGTFVHSHNQLIQITFELGILGLISMLIIIMRWIWPSRQEVRVRSASFKVVLIALGGLIGVLIPDALNSSMIIFLILFYFVWILPANEHLPTVDKTKGLLLLNFTAVLLAVSFGWLLWKIQPYDQALQAARQENWQGTNSALQIALERDPNNPYYLHALGFSEGQIACQNTENANIAEDYYQRSFVTYNNWGIDHANAAVLSAISGDYQNAAIQMELAIQNYPQDSTLRCLLGDYYSQLDKTEEGITSYTACISERPQFLDSPYWQEDKSRKYLIPIIFTQVENNLINRTDGKAMKLLAELYFAIDDLQSADSTIQDYLLQYPADLEGNLIHLQILDSTNDLSKRKELLEQLLISHPRNSDLWFYKGKLALQNGDINEAETSFTLGFRLQPSTESSLILGNYYLSQGDVQKSQEIYSNAFKITPYSRMNDFSRKVAFRWPMQDEYLDCMPTIRTYTDYFSPAIKAAAELEDQNCTLAACIYQALVDNNPGIETAQTRQNSLPCLDGFNPNSCFNILP